MKKILIICLSFFLVGCGSDTDEINKEALKYIRVGNYTEGLNILQKALKEDPEDDTTWNNISLCYDAIGEYQLALEAAQNAVNYGEENATEYSNLGNAYFDLGSIEEAKLAYKKSLDIDPENFYALYGMGIYYNEVEEYEKALEFFEYLYNNNPFNEGVVRFIAYANFKMGYIDESIEFLEEQSSKVSSPEIEELLDQIKLYKTNE